MMPQNYNPAAPLLQEQMQSQPEKKALLSFITVNKNNAEGLRLTLQSFNSLLELTNNSNYSIDLIVQDSCSNDSSFLIYSQLNNENTSFFSEPDTSIYHGMILGLEKAKSDYINFMNSGDVINATGFKIMLDSIFSDTILSNSLKCYYGSSSWRMGFHAKKLRRFNPDTIYLWPRFGIMPNHQAMIVDRQLCKKILFDYKLYPISADLDHKIKLKKSTTWRHVNTQICISESGGQSQRMNSIKHLGKRSIEVARIISNNYNIVNGALCFFLFFCWNFRKILPTKSPV